MASSDIGENLKKLKIKGNQEINILLLGETGVGKSTFINAIANYFRFKSFKKAAKGPLKILIPSVITLVTENFQIVKVSVGSEDKNEYQETGAAATQDVKTYVFPIGEGSTKVRLIDTPGMGDPRGIEFDDANCENILTYLSQLEQLHAICFLMKPTNPRITVMFEYCIKQILSRLEKSASRNIMFVFTNTRGSNFSGGETLPCLEKVISDIMTKQPAVQIPLRDNIFYLDNESFRVLAGIVNGVNLNEKIKQTAVESWEKSSKECWRLISYITGDISRDPLPPHQLKNSVSINEARRLIMHLSQPLADITQLICDNIHILARHQGNLRVENQSLDELKKKLYIPVVNLRVIKLTQPVTVCTSSKCADVYKVGDVYKWHYRQRCHDPCYLKNILKEHIGDPGLVHCAAMNEKICQKCTCHFTSHMHVYYMTKTFDDKIKDDVVMSNVYNKETALRESMRLIQQIQHRKDELEEERRTVIECTAQFAHFLQHNAITPFNDSYKAYIKYMISREQGLGARADETIIYHLEQLIKRYDEVKEAFDKSAELNDKLGSFANNPVTAKTIRNSIDKLFQLKHHGAKIRELFKSQRESRRQEYNKTCEYVCPEVSIPVKKKEKDQKKDKSASDNDAKKNNKSKQKGYTTDDGRTKKNFSGQLQQGNQPSDKQNIPQHKFSKEPPPPYITRVYQNQQFNRRDQSSPSRPKFQDPPKFHIKVEVNSSDQQEKSKQHNERGKQNYQRPYNPRDDQRFRPEHQTSSFHDYHDAPKWSYGQGPSYEAPRQEGLYGRPSSRGLPYGQGHKSRPQFHEAPFESGHYYGYPPSGPPPYEQNYQYRPPPLAPPPYGQNYQYTPPPPGPQTQEFANPPSSFHPGPSYNQGEAPYGSSYRPPPYEDHQNRRPYGRRGGNRYRDKSKPLNKNKKENQTQSSERSDSDSSSD